MSSSETSTTGGAPISCVNAPIISIELGTATRGVVWDRPTPLRLVGQRIDEARDDQVLDPAFGAQLANQMGELIVRDDDARACIIELVGQLRPREHRIDGHVRNRP